MGAWIALTLLVIAGLALLLRADAGSIAGFDPSDFAIAVAGMALLIFLGSSLAGSYRGRAGQAVRDLLTWVAGRLRCWSPATATARRSSASATASSASCCRRAPSLRGETQVDGERSVRIRRRPDGHFVVKTAGQRRVADACWSNRRLHRGAEAGRCPAARHRPRPAALHGAGADRQRHHLRGARAPAQPDASAPSVSTTSSAGGQARSA